MLEFTETHLYVPKDLEAQGFTSNRMPTRRKQRNKFRDDYKEEFSVQNDLMGMAIGRQGSNIQKARRVEGVLSVELRGNTFKVYGETQEAAKRARVMLEFTETHLHVPKDLEAKVVGRNGCSLKEIKDRSGLARLVRRKENTQEQNHVTLALVGTLDRIARASFLLRSSIEQLQEAEKLRQAEEAQQLKCPVPHVDDSYQEQKIKRERKETILQCENTNVLGPDDSVDDDHDHDYGDETILQCENTKGLGPDYSHDDDDDHDYGGIDKEPDDEFPEPIVDWSAAKRSKEKMALVCSASEDNVLEKWQRERGDLYTHLTTLTDELQTFHQKLSMVEFGGTVARTGGALLRIFGAMTGKETVGKVGSFLESAGGTTTAVTQILQEGFNFMAIQKAKDLLAQHKDTHSALIGKVNLSFKPRVPALDFVRSTTSLYKAVHSDATHREVVCKEDRVSVVLTTLCGILEWNMPALSETWEKMNARCIPETVCQLRRLTDELRRMQDDQNARFTDF